MQFTRQGVAHGDVTDFRDWTRIPSDVLKRWLETQPTMKLKDLLSGDRLRYVNLDSP